MIDDLQFVIALDDLSAVLFRLAQYPPGHGSVFHLGIIIDDQSTKDFRDSPMGMFLSAQVTGEDEVIERIREYLALPVWLRGNDMSFEYAIQSYDGKRMEPELSLCEFFDRLRNYLWFMGIHEYVRSEVEEGEVINVSVDHEGITKWMRDHPTGLFWLSQVCGVDTRDKELYRLVQEYLGILQVSKVRYI